jgi:hypothetical protein
MVQRAAQGWLPGMEPLVIVLGIDAGAAQLAMRVLALAALDRLPARDVAGVVQDSLEFFLKGHDGQGALLALLRREGVAAGN